MKLFIIFLAFVAVTVPQKNEERCICGLSKRINFGKTSEAENRIIGGEEAEVNEYPWMVRVKIGNITCGGSVVSDSWILTAAHCIHFGEKNRISSILGEHNTRLKIETRNLTMESNNVTTYPLFSKLRLKFGIFDQPFTKLSLFLVAQQLYISIRYLFYFFFCL